MHTRRRLGRSLVCAAVFAASAGSASILRADLKIDLRATTVNGVPLGAGQSPHQINGVGTGDVIGFNVFALVTGTDAILTNDRFRSLTGSFKSTAVGDNLRGNLKMDVLRSATDPDTGEQIAPFGFDAPGYSVGLQQDLDGDGDLDVGSNNPAQAANHFAVRYAVIGEFVPAALPTGALIGSGSFTVTSGSPTAATLISFFGRANNLATLYEEDGVSFPRPSTDSPSANGILLTTVPEPAALGIASLLAFGALRRRR
jgi:MYXO-CTERM domain-containing protein